MASSAYLRFMDYLGSYPDAIWKDDDGHLRLEILRQTYEKYESWPEWHRPKNTICDSPASLLVGSSSITYYRFTVTLLLYTRMDSIFSFVHEAMDTETFRLYKEAGKIIGQGRARKEGIAIKGY